MTYRIADILLDWYSREGRDLPWRRTRDPYRIWLSEVILQQTRVAQGTEYYLRFVGRFPDVRALAAASGRRGAQTLAGGWVITAVPGTSMPPPGRSWTTSKAASRRPSPGCVRCAAWATIRPPRSVRRPTRCLMPPWTETFTASCRVCSTSPSRSTPPPAGVSSPNWPARSSTSAIRGVTIRRSWTSEPFGARPPRPVAASVRSATAVLPSRRAPSSPAPSSRGGRRCATAGSITFISPRAGGPCCAAVRDATSGRVCTSFRCSKPRRPRISGRCCGCRVSRNCWAMRRGGCSAVCLLRDTSFRIRRSMRFSTASRPLRLRAAEALAVPTGTLGDYAVPRLIDRYLMSCQR